MQPRKWWRAVCVFVALMLLHEAALAQSRTCDGAGGMVDVPPSPADPTKARVEGTIWFLPSSVLKQLTDAAVTIEVFNLMDPLLPSTSKKQPLPGNGVVRVQWTREDLDALFGTGPLTLGARIRLTRPLGLKKPVLFGPGRTDPGPAESVALSSAQVVLKYAEQDDSGQGSGNVPTKYDVKPTECQEDEE